MLKRVKNKTGFRVAAGVLASAALVAVLVAAAQTFWPLSSQESSADSGAISTAATWTVKDAAASEEAAVQDAGQAAAESGAGDVGGAGADAASAEEVSSAGEVSVESDEVLVSFSASATAEDVLTALSSFDEVDAASLDVASVAEQLDSGYVTVPLVAGADVQKASQALQACEVVEAAQPNYVYYLMDADDETAEEGGEAEAEAEDETEAENAAAAVAEADADASGEGALASQAKTNDPSMQRETYSTSALANSWQLACVNAYDAWDYAQCNNTVTVVVMDTGCNMEQEDLQANLLKDYAYNAYNAVQNEEAGEQLYDTTLTKDFATTSASAKWHGTHVCGIIAATANNGLGTAGVSYNANVLPICVFDGNGAKSDTKYIVAAYQRVFQLCDEHPELNIHVVNLSVGGYATSLDEDDLLLQSTIERAVTDYNIVTVCSAGNGSKTTFNMPSDFDACVSVTALDVDGTSPASFSDYNQYKDICAPGRYIYSTMGSGTSVYGNKSGTSQASPLVAGAFALLWSIDPDLTVAEAKETLYSTASSSLTVATGREGLYGAGILDVKAAVLSLVPVYIDRTHLDVAQDGTLQMVGGNNTDDTLTWQVTSGTGSATIEEKGLLTGVSAGTVTVTATAGQESYSVDVEVHDVTHVAACAATCTQDGNEEYWQCATCGAIFADAQLSQRTSMDAVTISALGHDFDEKGICSRCGLGYSVSEYTGWGLYLVKYQPASSAAAIETGCATFNGCDMLWLKSQECWALVVQGKPTVDSSSFDVNEQGERVEVDSPGYEVEGRTLGDLTENGRLNIVDAQMAYELATAVYDFDECSQLKLLRADINGNGYLESADALVLQQAIHVGWGIIQADEDKAA